MARRKPILLYSTNSWLAHFISREFYDDRHYVWCAPYISQQQAKMAGASQAASSCPVSIRREFAQAVDTGDKDCAKIRQNRAGLINGAEQKHSLGTISTDERDEIVEIVDVAEIGKFKPLVYVIPYDKAETEVIRVPIADRASPTSSEYLIEALRTDQFHLLSEGDW